eukprot:3792603-Pyramimonas_sp.AAC.1
MSRGVLTCLGHDLTAEEPLRVSAAAEGPAPMVVGIASEQPYRYGSRPPTSTAGRTALPSATASGARLTAMVRGPQGTETAKKYYFYGCQLTAEED